MVQSTDETHCQCGDAQLFAAVSEASQTPEMITGSCGFIWVKVKHLKLQFITDSVTKSLQSCLRDRI